MWPEEVSERWLETATLLEGLCHRRTVEKKKKKTEGRKEGLSCLRAEEVEEEWKERKKDGQKEGSKA